MLVLLSAIMLNKEEEDGWNFEGRNWEKGIILAKSELVQVDEFCKQGTTMDCNWVLCAQWQAKSVSPQPTEAIAALSQGS